MPITKTQPTRCNSPSDTDGISYGNGQAQTFKQAETLAIQDAIRNATIEAKAVWKSKRCPKKCPDKQGGFAVHKGHNWVVTTIKLESGEYVVQAACTWTVTLLCRWSETES